MIKQYDGPEQVDLVVEIEVPGSRFGGCGGARQGVCPDRLVFDRHAYLSGCCC